MTLIIRGGSHGIQVYSNCGKAKICDPCMAGRIDEDIWLDVSQRRSKMELRTITYSLKITMNYVARVEVVNAICDIR